MSTPFPRARVLSAIVALAAASLPAQPPIHVFGGDGAGDNSGWSVSGAGDVNGDGHADVIVGAPLDDDNGAESGSARVLSGADGSTLYTFLGDAAGDNFGWSVAGAGDVNGDGYADLIVGAPLDDDNGAESGSARVLSGRNGATLHTFLGDAAGDNFGWSVAGAGDVNGDGYDDVIVGAPLDDDNGAESGSARVLSGRDGSTLYTFLGDAAGDNFGWSVAAASDVDGDCFADVVVGAPLDDNNGSASGMARLLSGATGSTLWSADGDGADDNFGWSVAGAGDADGDGAPDVVVGAPLDDNNGTDSGMARVVSGATGGTIHSFDGDHAGDNLGWSVGGHGDVDGDGVPDVITGSPLHGPGGTTRGRASVWSGDTGLRLWVVGGQADQDNLGWSVDIAGDLDGDGFADLVAGAPLADLNGGESGSALAFARKPFDTLVLVKTHTPAASPGLFGSDHMFMGDVDGDGVGDYAIGAVADMGAQGVVRVFSGATHDVIHAIPGGMPNIFFGPTIGRVGDVDGDGHADILTGAQHWKITAFEGRATLRSGKDGTVIWERFGDQSNSHMGSALGGIGDIDGDNFGDVFVGLLKQNTGTGVVRAYSGRTGTVIYEIPGAQQGEWFSQRGASIGDLDGDQIMDYAVGAPQPATLPAAGPGYVVVLSGVDGSQIWRFNGINGGDLFGWGLAAPGDVNGDGVDDVIVGAQGHDLPGKLNAGMARVYSGADGSVLYHKVGEFAGDGFGEFVSGAGDVNGDGYADFMVGAPGFDVGILAAAGRGYLYSGQDGSLMQTFDGITFTATNAKALCGIGDSNGDGYADVSVGAINDPTAGVQSGAARVYESTTKSDPGAFWAYGSACPGSNGKLPKIRFAGRPVLSQSFDAKVVFGPSLQLATLGFDGAQQNIPLGFLGAPACTFWALPVIAVTTATDVDGKAALTLAVPNVSALVGANLYLQWILQDPATAPLPFVFSDAGRVTIGTP